MKFSHLFLPVALVVLLHACVHEPILPSQPNPSDTTEIPMDTLPGDTLPGDTIPPDTTSSPDTSVVVKPCDPDTVYFSRDLLPVIISNCAKSGCHDEASAQDGVILSTYEQILQTADVRPGNPGGSDFFEVLIEDDPDKQMPPPPNDPLSDSMISLIQTWIFQGAQDLSCGDSTTVVGCDTIEVSYSGFLVPLLTQQCTGCHSGNNPSGGISLNTYAGVASVANSGQLYGAIAHQNGYSEMPQGGAKWSDCNIRKLKSWIDAGAPNN